ncbi:hypothetical protein IF1G_06135 [Cordyceps javanica]|uniref:Uncharacterized protein n=1 Tax=Cordyceps javanica TaxID=43265 RepID=A0A545V0B2_9HYPO|nr:hypothetical protein IF1G_06135 [Cordyceps javanica]
MIREREMHHVMSCHVITVNVDGKKPERPRIFGVLLSFHDVSKLKETGKTKTNAPKKESCTMQSHLG